VPEVPPSESLVLVSPAEMRVEGIGVNALDAHRVDVAVDLTPCRDAVDIEMVIVGPDDEEQCSIVLVQDHEWMLDKIMHMRREAQPGEYTLHVGVFYEKELVARAARTFRFPPAESG
jgi:hypothetical protein